MTEKFESISKAEWLEKVRGDLKGKPIDSLNWSLDGDEFTPFFHRDDGITSGKVSNRANNDWSIGYTVDVDRFAHKSNIAARNALMQGANCLKIVLPHQFDLEQMKAVLEGVRLDWIRSELRLTNRKMTSEDMRLLSKYCLDEQLNQSDLDVSFDLNAFSYSIHDQFPLSRQFVIYADGPNQSLSDRLCKFLEQANKKIKSLANEGVPKEKWESQFVFEVHLNSIFHENVSLIRALHLILAALLDAWGIDYTSKTRINAIITPDKNQDQVYTNQIDLTVQALSAVVAGVSCLHLEPADKHLQIDYQSFTSRLAVNISNIMMEESYLDYVNDPVAGSHFYEALSESLAKRAWEKFQSKDHHS